jgi:23S rRNA pseudouridine1911/1915/1917 synthase
MKPLQVSAPSPLLEYLYASLKDLKKTKVKQMLKFGSVRVNGKITTSHSHPLKPGDKVDFLGKKEAATERARKELQLDILHEDKDVIVVNKPAGLLTMSTETESERTLYFELTAYERSKWKDGKGRVFIVHRLDRDTSGLLVFAKNPRTKVFLQENWDQAVKKYHAVVEGTPAEPSGDIRSALSGDKFRRVYASKDKNAKDSVTHYRVLQTNGQYSLLDLKLETGRKNQIRVHLADLGHPVAGDAKYGAQSDPLGRMALHAYHLSFPHPTIQERTMSFHCEAPHNFKKLVL